MGAFSASSYLVIKDFVWFYPGIFLDSLLRPSLLTIPSSTCSFLPSLFLTVLLLLWFTLLLYTPSSVTLPFWSLSLLAHSPSLFTLPPCPLSLLTHSPSLLTLSPCSFPPCSLSHLAPSPHLLPLPPTPPPQVPTAHSFFPYSRFSSLKPPVPTV